MMATEFTRQVIAILRRVPRGRVATYSQIAAVAGFPGAARQVVWVLHTSSEKEHLPWHRIINARGRISLKKGDGYERQRSLLIDEGVVFDADDTIDLDRFLWSPG